MKLIILDRDGVINHESEHLRVIKSEDFIFIPGSLEAIAKLKLAGYIVAIATNQAIIANKLASRQQVSRVHAYLQQQLMEAYKVKIDKIVLCPHNQLDNCYCRKPNPGMLLDIARSYKINQYDKVPFVGDASTDVLAAKAAGMVPVIVNTGKGPKTIADPKIKDLPGMLVFKDLADFVQYWIAKN